MILNSSLPFDLELTLNSGQFFHWKEDIEKNKNIKKSARFNFLFKNSVIKIKQISDTKLEYDVTGNILNKRDVEIILGINNHRTELFDRINKEKKIKELVRKYSGLTILRQDPYECLISFLTSMVSNIKRITKNLNDLRILLGTPIHNTDFQSLPDPKTIVDSGEQAIRKIGFGFRAKYLIETCQTIINNEIDLNSWNGLSDEELKSRLLSFPGIGDKIAECIILFSYGRLSAFPVDVWIKRALEALWKNEPQRPPKQWCIWAKDRWGADAGYIQQILYCAVRNGDIS